MNKLKLMSIVSAMVMVTSAVATSCSNSQSNNSSGHTHKFGDWSTVSEATCTSNGLRKRSCMDDSCDYEESDVITALGHEYQDDVCTRCGAGSNSIANLVYGADYVSLYEKFGSEISIADVKEDIDSSGRHNPYIEKDGQKYSLGLDFLSMAMVYNTQVPSGSEYTSSDEVYAKWWMYYIERWNELLPEIPLYSNEYYDLYNTKIKGVSENPTNPYWGAANALIDWSSEKPNNDIIIGSVTDLSGKFRYPSFGASQPGASDNDIARLTSGLETVVANKEGGYQWNDTVVKEHSEVINSDGTKTFTIEIKDGLKFSDGSAVSAKNYLATLLVFSSPVGTEAANRDHKLGQSYVGYKAFSSYNGTNDGVDGASKYFSGIKLLSDNKFSVTVGEDYANYYYAIAQASFSPEYLKAWIGDNDIIVDPESKSVGLSDGFYTKSGESYAMSSHIKSTANDTSKLSASVYPYSGPYVVESYDASKHEAVLKKNEYFAGNYEGVKPSISKVVYTKIISATQLASFRAGNLDFISGITGGSDTDEAISYADGSNGQAAYIHYGRAGYGKLGFRADFGSVQFKEVRQALAYTMDRSQFALDFNGGYGGTVDGPYYKGSWMYKAVEDDIKLSSYAKSQDSAIEVLVAGGWIYGADGKPYVSGVRYKKIMAKDMNEKDVNFGAKDGSASTKAFNADGQEITSSSSNQVVSYYLMPLVINWYGTSDNDFSTYIISYLATGNSLASKVGFKICYTMGDFQPMLDELYQQQVYGFYSGTPMYNMFNFATGFNSAAYDFSYNNTIDPSMYDDYSQYYIKDEYDFYMIKK